MSSGGGLSPRAPSIPGRPGFGGRGETTFEEFLVGET
jgi:hypothetical protein